ncbi:hypothetical protein I3842_15G081000 [Carya illinoinensis]|uniref:MADS-box domain-containing protein n=1 Tax=Carya illinoinensis TaxID=32201 RepID=A0A922ACF3_CARIL|nr:hypothetical protein I3842_15G081000 [Carya illinoinensis]
MVIQKKMSKGKKTRGRQRIEIMELHRADLFKKAGKLCVLCGAEVAIIAFSPHNNVFCFDHPDVETVLDRYLAGNHSQYAEAQEELAREKKQLAEIEDEVKRKKTENNGEYLWEEAVHENMELEEMEHYMSALQKMLWKVESRLEQFRMMRSATDSWAWDWGTMLL